MQNIEGATMYNNIADALNGYFVESFTREEGANRLEGLLNTHNVLADIEMGKKEALN